MPLPGTARHFVKLLPIAFVPSGHRFFVTCPYLLRCAPEK
jgi:hypothetical protein